MSEPQSSITQIITDVVDGHPKAVTSENGRITRVELTSEPGLPFHAAFVDNHCHILPTGLDLAALHLGGASSHAEVLDRLRDRHRSYPEGWLLAVHYDQNRYDGVHLTAADLDRIATDRPILLRHVNGHAGVANTAALTAAKIGPLTEDPAGGTFGRDASGAPNGVLFEHALEVVSAAIPVPTAAEMTQAIRLASQKMQGLGIAAAADMMTGRFDLRSELLAYAAAAREDSHFTTALYLQWSTVFGKRAIPYGERMDLIRDLEATGRSFVKGIKIFADGAIGSATAAIYGSYRDQPPAETSGQLIYNPDRLNMMVRTAHDAGYPVAVHAIGDYAIDLVLDAFAATDEPSRHRLEHAMILSDAQIDRIAKLGCFVTMQPEFLLRFGANYRRQLPDATSWNLKRFRSVIDAGIPLSFSSDRPIVAGDPRDGIRLAVTREGFSPEERVTIAEAVRAYTTAGAAAMGLDDRFGKCEVGHPAPLVPLDYLP